MQKNHLSWHVEASIQQGALALQAAGEGQARGAAAAAGGVQMALMNQEAQNRAANE